VSDELVIRQVWPVPRGHSVLSPFEASEDFEQACWQANEVIAASPPDLFYTFTRAGGGSRPPDHRRSPGAGSRL